MAIRLYPKTTDPDTLEKLANVPAGTHAKREAVKARGLSMDQEREAMTKDKDVHRYDHFMIFGWGRFNATKATEGYAGSTDIEAEIIEVLDVNWINTDSDLVIRSGGISWN